MEIENSTALVTGANRGIGRAIAEALAAHGASVLAGVRAVDQDHGVPELANLRAVRVDLSSRESIETCVGALEDARIDILINNAGVFEGGLLETQPVDRIYELLQSSLTGPIHLTRLLLPGMLHRRRGKIVNNASIIGHAPFAGATVYAAAKAGVHGFTESLRQELEQTELTVLELITPGVDTDMMQQVQEQLSAHVDTSGWDHVEPDEWAEKVVDAIRSDDDELNPGGAERLAKLLPPAVMNLAARLAFDR
ncbi:MAG: SDR family oxidoreductase [Solirubrobacteraceae bacterium]